MSDPANVHADEGMNTTNGSNVRIHLVGFDRPFFTALAVVLSLASAMFCFFMNVNESRRVYFTQRCEAYVEQAAFDHKPIPYRICGPREK